MLEREREGNQESDNKFLCAHTTQCFMLLSIRMDGKLW